MYTITNHCCAELNKCSSEIRQACVVYKLTPNSFIVLQQLLMLCSFALTVNNQWTRADTVLSQTILFSCLFFSIFIHFFWPCACVCVQDYSEEFRDISSKGKRSGHIPEGAITLLNQRTVGDDLPVMMLTVYTTLTLPPVTHEYSSHTQHTKSHILQTYNN